MLYNVHIYKGTAMKNDQNMPKDDMMGITKVITAHAEVNPTKYSG